MLRINEILPYYQESLRVHREFILREYLQYKILQIVFNIPEYNDKLCFLGGSCATVTELA